MKFLAFGILVLFFLGFGFFFCRIVGSNSRNTGANHGGGISRSVDLPD